MGRPTEHLLVTDAQCLRISDLRQAGVLDRPGEIRFVPLASTKSLANAPMLACYLVANPGAPRLAMAHHAGTPGLARQVRCYWVLLHEGPVHFGGSRYWFVCSGQRCPNALSAPVYQGEKAPSWRATALYLPPGGVQFLCRDCHRLTYRSKQLHYGRTRPKSRPSSAAVPEDRLPSPPPTLRAARARLHRCLQGVVAELNEGKEDAVTPPDPTLRQQAVWHLWCHQRVPVAAIAELFGVTVRTICRDLAALRVRGWQRPGVKDTPARLSLDLIGEARVRLDAAFRSAYRERPTSGRLPSFKAMLAEIQHVSRLEADLVLAASDVVRSTERAEQDLSEWEAEAMRQELAAALATMLRR
jgi:hypothetical protein